MKKLGIVILLMTLIAQGFSQQASADIQAEEQNNNEKREVVIGKDFMKYSVGDSAVNIKIGNRGLTILESLESDGTKVKIRKYDDNEDREDFSENHGNNDTHYVTQYRSSRSKGDNHGRRNRHFKGHWSGVEFGFNNYTTSYTDHYIPDEIGYMTIHSGKSNNFNVNFSQLSLGITRHIGFVTGFGVTFNNYRFDGNNNIRESDNGIIEELDPGSELEKSKLTTFYAHVPLLLEIQIPVSYHHLNIAAGPIGAVKIASHSKMVFENKQKVKSNSDFNLNMLRYGATARLGYSDFQVYGTYYFSPMFQTSKTPGGFDLYPFEIGVAFTFN
ncbi:MAG TPA: hypothetical protein VHO50_04500 [Bacteroidales bacterium]|nr:hypothetical protein [Bacteroidales bacterium]